MTTADRQALRTEALDYARLEHQLRIEASGFRAVADRAGDLLTPAASRLERTRVEALRRGYRQMAEDLDDIADEAKVYADDARSCLGAV